MDYKDDIDGSDDEKEESNGDATVAAGVRHYNHMTTNLPLKKPGG